MDWSLEDLFAEPPPKIADDGEDIFASRKDTTTIFEDACPEKMARKANNNQCNDIRNENEVEMTQTSTILMSSDKDEIECLRERCKNSNDFGISREKQKICNEKSLKQEPSSEKKESSITVKQYYVPKLEDILKSQAAIEQPKTVLAREEGHVCNYGGHPESPYSEMPRNDCNAVNEDFKKQFDKKDSKIFKFQGKNPEEVVKRKFEMTGSKMANYTHTDVNGNAGHVAQDINEPLLKRRKAGNYRRKLHTKCRISAKEIRRITNSSMKDDEEFFGEISERPMNIEVPKEVIVAKFEGCKTFSPVDGGQKLLNGMKNVKKQTEKQKARKQKKNKKRKDKKGVLNGNKLQSVVDVLENDDDIVLLPRKELKPHKWPVCKQIIKADKNKGISEKTKGEVNIKEENKGCDRINLYQKDQKSMQNSVLDAILNETASFYGKAFVNKVSDKQVSESRIFKDLCKTEAYKTMNSSSTSLLPGITKTDASRTESLPSLSITKTDDRMFDDKQCDDRFKIDAKFDKTPEDTLVTKVDWYQSMHRGNFGKNENNIKMLKSKGENDNGNRSDINNDDDKVGGDDDYDDDVNKKESKNDDNTELNVDGDKTSQGTALESQSVTVNQQTMNEDGSKSRKSSGQEFINQGSCDVVLLSNVFNLPVDLSIAGKDKKPPAPVRQKRGGGKKKGKKRKKNENRKSGKVQIKIETKPKVLCKYFLDGKCSKGADCRFQHEGIPQRRELCRYYVTDCCLAENCIFMHSEFPCKFFHAYSKCSQGSNCKYSHEPLTEETKRLLDELLLRDAALKKITSNQNAEEQIESEADGTLHDNEAETKLPNLYSSLI